MKTSELTGAALDWVVAKCEGITTPYIGHFRLPILEAVKSHQYSPSTLWEQGGPIIERERFVIAPASSTLWAATSLIGNCTRLGTIPLIAAMRCYVTSKLGDEVEIPEELT